MSAPRPRTLTDRLAALKRRYAQLHARRRSTEVVQRDMIRVTTSLIKIANREDRKCKSA